MWQDFRFGIRTLAKSPGFFAVAIAALAIGIGANATVFSLANAVLFKNLPFADSSRVLYLSTFDVKNPRNYGGLSRPDYNDLRVQLKSFSGLGAATRELVNLSDDSSLPEAFFSSRITANGFAVLGQQPALGRFFTGEDEKSGAEAVTVLSWTLWSSRYGKDPSVVGRKIRINSVPSTVIGIAAEGFALPADAALWTAYPPEPNQKQRQNRGLTVFGKLAPGATQETAQAEVALSGRRLSSQYPENKDIRYRVENFNENNLRGEIRTVFVILLGAVGFVLLIACANVANLMLARAIGRAREISIRAALGAGRWRVIRQLLAESLLLSLAGGFLGWLIGRWGIRAFDMAVIPTGKPAWINFAMDYRVFAYLGAVTLATAMLFGLAPALRLARFDVNAGLKEGGRAGTGIRGRYLAGTLVVLETMLAVVLLAGAGLMMRSFLYSYQRPAGVDTTHVITMRIRLPEARYGNPEAQLGFQRRLLERLRGLPGVENATVASSDFGVGSLSFPYEIEGAPSDAEHRPSTGFLLAGDGYFETMRLTARRGRLLNSADHRPGANGIVVNEAMANQLWPNQEAIGKRLRYFKENAPGPWLSVIGVVPNYLQGHRVKPEPVAILSFHQETRPWMTILGRTRTDAAAPGNAFRREIQALDPDLPVRDVRTLDEALALSRWPLRVFGTMFALFAGVALLLATVGLCAVVAYGVNQRTQEIGVRVALGASTGSILRLVLGTGMWQAGIGLALGLASAFGVTRVLSSLLVGVSPTDPLTFAAVTGMLLMAAALGCLLPARRAMRVDAAIALRNE